MRCPTLAELPPPPAGKTGWPWTEACAQLPDAMPDGRPWPRISIVTPSYNQGAFIEETIRSILLQGYPDLEYVVMDGGSTDGAVDVIRRYEPWLAAWRSEPDRGQAHAINKGFTFCSGEIFHWINSDDVVSKYACYCVATNINAELGIAGGVLDFDERTSDIYMNRDINVPNLVLFPRQFHQPGIWLKKAAFEQFGPLDENLHYTFDKKLMITLLDRYPDSLRYIDDVLVKFRLHDRSKTVGEKEGFARDNDAIASQLRFSLSRHNRRACELRLGRKEWARRLLAIRQSTDPYHVRMARLLLEMLRDPRIRMSRATLGVIRRLHQTQGRVR